MYTEVLDSIEKDENHFKSNLRNFLLKVRKAFVYALREFEIEVCIVGLTNRKIAWLH